jgi:predicted metal-dependent peptidase
MTESRKLVLKPLTAAEIEKARQTMAAGRYLARKAAPYFQRILMKLVIREVPPMVDLAGNILFGTVGVSESMIMYSCMEYVATLTPETMAGDFLHESLHLFMRHAQRRGLRDHERYNRAGDLAINTITRDMGVKQTPVAIWPKDYGFDEHLSADEYYMLLEKLEKSGKGKKGQGGSGQDGKGPPSPGAGHCGSCAGHKLPIEGDDPAGRTETEVESAVREVAMAIKSHAQSQGKLPAGLALMADDMLAPPKVPWQQHLSRVVRASCAWTSGAVYARYNHPSRRQAAIGYGVGRPILPALRRPTPRVAVVVDTSGSMGSGPGSPLAAATSEVMGVVKAVGAEVQFIAVDAAVHANAKVRGAQDLLQNIKGGGGTSFVPGFEAAEKLRPRVNVVIYMTDGWGDAPPEAPRGMRVIWCLIGKGAPHPATYGEVVRIED